MTIKPGKAHDPDDAFLMCLDAKYVQPGLLLGTQGKGRAHDWVILSVAQEATGRKWMVVEMQNVSTGNIVTSTVSPEDVVTRKVYRHVLFNSYTAKPVQDS